MTILVSIILLLAFIAVCMVVFPIYGVWTSKKRGEAALAEANFSEQVAIAEANARLKSSDLNKRAEIIEAQAVSESIEIIGDTLQRNSAYLRWQWIKSISDTENEVIYIPTEAGLPILEAGKRWGEK